MINVDVLQKGWNKLSIKFFDNNQQQPKIELERVLSIQQDTQGKDINRFFDQTIPQYQFNEQTNTLTLIPCRIEYFRQQITSNENCLYILLKLEFQHEKGQIKQTSPQQYDTRYNEYIRIINLQNPSIMCHTTSFSEIHYLKTELILILNGEGFEQKYNISYQNIIDQCKNPIFLSQILHSDVIRHINTLPKQIFVLGEKAIENKFMTDNDVILSQRLNETLELLADTKQVNEVDLNNIDSQVEEQMEQEQTDELNIEDLDQQTSEENCNSQFQFNTSTNIQQVYFTNKMLIKSPQVYEIGITRPTMTLQKLQQSKDYSKQQIEFLYQIYTENFINCTKNMSRALSLTQTGKANIFITVHGYKGSKFDLKFFSKILQQKIQELGTQIVLISLDYNNSKNTNFYELGNKLYIQLKQQLIQQFGKTWLNHIKSINFIGFSQGNIVIESIITHFSVDLLIKLNMFISLNGPILGTKKQQKITQFGQRMIKSFANKNENYCIRQLENIPESRATVQPYQVSVPYIQQILDYQTTIQQQTGISCMQSGKVATQESFQQLRYLDLLAFNTRLFYFKKILLFGSLYDGYVNYQSEVALWDDILQIKLNDLIKEINMMTMTLLTKQVKETSIFKLQLTDKVQNLQQILCAKICSDINIL